MPLAQVPTYGPPGESGISDTAIVLIILAAVIAAPILFGLVVRFRDRRTKKH